MSVFKPVATVLSLCAAGSLAAIDVAAAELPSTGPAVAVATPGVFETEAMEANDHRYYRYRRHRRVDAGDVLAGVLIIGGIAAIANAAAKNNRDRDYRYRDRDYRYRDRDYRDRDARYRDRRYDNRYDDSRGIDRAVDMCVREVERDARVDRVDSVERDGNGWEVEGRLYNGEEFSCRIGSDGRIEDLDIDDRDVAYADSVEDRQWDDQRYAQARARMDRQPTTAQPSYPGGPLPGDEIDGDTASQSDDDGRYETHNSPDFEDA